MASGPIGACCDVEPLAFRRDSARHRLFPVQQRAGKAMRGQAAALAVVLLGTAAPIGAQSEQAAEEPRTAEQFIETAREAYSVRERPEPIVCAAPVGNEIVVCARSDKPDDQRLASPTDRAYAAGELPPDPIPS